MRVAFGGGGTAEDERFVLDLFGAWVGTGRVLYVPFAMEPPYGAALEWVTGALGPRGITDIAMAASPSGVRDLAGADGVFIGGGNTFSLLYTLRSTGTDQVLSDAIDRGLPTYGGSAGAIILGRDVETAAHADPNDLGISDTTGLDLALGYSIACHYTPTDDRRIRENVRRAEHPVLALPERGGLARTGTSMVVVGPDPAMLFELDGTRTTLEMGTSVPARRRTDDAPGVDSVR